MESEAARLAALVASAAEEQDKFRRHYHSLLLLLHHQAPDEHASDTMACAMTRSASRAVLVFCNVTNKIRKRTDTAVAFTQEYSRVS